MEHHEVTDAVCKIAKEKVPPLVAAAAKITVRRDRKSLFYED